MKFEKKEVPAVEGDSMMKPKAAMKPKKKKPKNLDELKAMAKSKMKPEENY